MATAPQLIEPEQPDAETLYERDYHAWIMRQVEALRTKRLADLDVTNLLDEVEDLGKSERRELASRLEVLLVHLLKWLCQPERRGSSWEATIKLQRIRLRRRMDESPSLRSMPATIFDDEYQTARLAAAKETGLNVDSFPERPPFTVEQAMDDAFLPSDDD